MKDLALEHRLATIQDSLVNTMQAIAEHHAGRLANPRMIAQVRAEMDGALLRALTAENITIRRHVWVAIVGGRLSISVSVPSFDHDCERCAFLGRIDLHGDVFDLYTCDAHPWPPTRRIFVARYGDHDWQCTIGADSALDHFHPALYVAQHRWRNDQ